MRTSINWKRELLLFIIIFLGLVLISFGVWNYRALWQNFVYDASAPRVEGQILGVAASENGIYEDAVPSPVEVGENSASSEDTEHDPNSSQSAAYVLHIPKIGVQAPIAFAHERTTQAVLDSMERGVALYPGSSLPGGVGRSVLLGHSSRASWYNGEYATIFSLLAKLDPLDEFTITTKEGVIHTYIVFSKQYLSPDEANAVLAGPTAPGEVDLVTCWPIGSASQRTLIRAKLVSSD